MRHLRQHHGMQLIHRTPRASYDYLITKTSPGLPD
jgi:hypothetical protein